MDGSVSACVDVRGGREQSFPNRPDVPGVVLADGQIPLPQEDASLTESTFNVALLAT